MEVPNLIQETARNKVMTRYKLVQIIMTSHYQNIISSDVINVNTLIIKCHYYKVMSKTFRENLRDELDYQDMKVKELSVATGIPKPTLDCYLSARQVIPPADIAVKIAKVLNVSVEYLICGDDAKVVPKEYSRFHPFRSILEDLSVLSDDSIEKLQIMIHALAENKK